MSWTFEIPRVNPLRFRPVNTGLIDYSTIFPAFDLMTRGEQYQPQEQPADTYPDWLVNQTLYLQISLDVPILAGLLCKLISESGTETSCTATIITPVGWVGFPVFQISVTPIETGIHYIYAEFPQTFPDSSIQNLALQSDEFYVSDNSDKKLIELQFKNSTNNLGMYWNRYYKAYYTATFKESDGEQENSVFKTDTGTTLLNSKDYGGIDVTFCDIHKRYKRTIEKQLRCDSILFNGMECICEQAPTSEDTEFSDVINITARLTFKNSDDLFDLL